MGKFKEGLNCWVEQFTSCQIVTQLNSSYSLAPTTAKPKEQPKAPEQPKNDGLYNLNVI